MIRAINVIVPLFLLLLLPGTALPQENLLELFPRDSSLLMEVDVPMANELIHEGNRGYFDAIMFDLGPGIFEEFDKLYAGVSNIRKAGTGDHYILLKGKFNASDLVEYIRKNDGRRNDFRQTGIGTMQAWYDSRNKDSEKHIADTNGGFVIVGTKKGLRKFLEVESGKIANATENESLSALYRMLSQAGGIQTIGTADFNSLFEYRGFALGVERRKGGFYFRIEIITSDSDAVGRIEGTLKLLEIFAPIIDQSGRFGNIVGRIRVVTKGERITVSLNAGSAAIEYLNRNADTIIQKLLFRLFLSNVGIRE